MASSIGKSLEAARLSSGALQQATTFPLKEFNEPDFANKYELGPQVGRGGFAVVYAATRIADGLEGIYYLEILHVIYTF
jgi:hypothetical protein